MLYNLQLSDLFRVGWKPFAVQISFNLAHDRLITTKPGRVIQCDTGQAKEEHKGA
jgi:hypothetical protein